jgi:hypothetical protein
MSLIKQRFWFFFALTTVFIYAVIIQNTMLLNGDVSWDLLATRRLLAGGTYSHDFFDLNPPLILWLYSPVIALIKLLTCSTAFALKLYVFALSFLSLRLCSSLLRPSFSGTSSALLFYSLLLVLSICYFILPGTELGERDQLLFVFSMPYFLMVNSRLQAQTQSAWFAVGIGIFAFMGFALKPYFLLPWFFVEAYATVKMRCWWFCLRWEVVSIMVLLLLYCIGIILFYPDYITRVVPLAQRFYYLGFATAWEDNVSNFAFMFSCFPLVWLVFSALLKRRFIAKEDASLSAVLGCALFGFLGSYLLQRTYWFYHLFPAFAMAMVLVTLWYVRYLTKERWASPLSLGLSALVYCVPQMQVISNQQIAHLYQYQINPLRHFLQENAKNRPVYFISVSPREIFPAVDEAGAIYASRLLHLFWLPSLVKTKTGYLSSALLKPQDKVHEERLNAMVAEDIAAYQPQYVFVDVKQCKAFCSLLRFEYLPYLLKNAKFREVWKPYRYFATIESPALVIQSPKANLYVVSSLKQIKPADIEGQAIILKGTGDARELYFVEHHHFLSLKERIINPPITLTPDELLRLSHYQGKVAKTAENLSFIARAMKQANSYPLFKYEVYTRDLPKC